MHAKIQMLICCIYQATCLKVSIAHSISSQLKWLLMISSIRVPMWLLPAILALEIYVFESNSSFFIIGVTVIWWPRYVHIFKMMIKFRIAWFRVNCRACITYGTPHRFPLSLWKAWCSYRCVHALFDRHAAICLSLSLCVVIRLPTLMASARLALHSASYHLGALPLRLSLYFTWLNVLLQACDI